MKKHPEVIALALLALFSMAAVSRPVQSLQISTSFRQPVVFTRPLNLNPLPQLNLRQLRLPRLF